MDNTNNTRFNMPMSSIDSKGLQYLSDRLSKNPNSRFVCAIARLNPKGTAYIGMNKSGKEFVTIPVVADYADKAAHYAGLSDKEDGAGLFYTLMISGSAATRYANMLRKGMLRSGTELILTGLSEIRETTGRDGKTYRNPTVYVSTLDISRWAKKENTPIALRDNVGGGAAPAATKPAAVKAKTEKKTEPREEKPAAAPQPAFQAPSMNDDMELLEDSDDLPF